MKKTYTFITLITLLSLAQLPSFAQDWNLQSFDYSYYGFSKIMQVVIDDNAYPHVLYQREGDYSHDDRFYYAKWTGTAWSIEEVQHQYPRYAKFCLDANNNPHIISTFYYSSSYQKTYYTYRNGAGNLYSKQLYEITYDPISVYFENGVLKGFVERNGIYYLGSYTNGNFNLVNIGTPPISGGSYNSVQDDEGNIYFVFDSGPVQFGFFDGTEISILQVAVDAGYPSITLDNNDIPHISYYETVNKDLMHAKLPVQTMKALKEGKFAINKTTQTISK